MLLHQGRALADAAESLAYAGDGPPGVFGGAALRRPVYDWSWLAAASPRHQLLIRHHHKTGEQAFHNC